MRKLMKKVVAIALAATMMIPAMGISAKAATEKVVRYGVGMNYNFTKDAFVTGVGTAEVNNRGAATYLGSALFQFDGIDTSREILGAELRLISERAKSTKDLYMYSIEDSLYNTSKAAEVEAVLDGYLKEETNTGLAFDPKSSPVNYGQAMFDPVEGSGTEASPYKFKSGKETGYEYDVWVNKIDVTSLMSSAQDGMLTVAVMAKHEANEQTCFITHDLEGYANKTRLGMMKWVMGLVDSTGNAVPGADVAAIAYPMLTITYGDAVSTEVPKYDVSLKDETGEVQTLTEVEYNSKLTLTAQAEDAKGNPFLYWVKNGCLVSKTLTYSYHVNEDADIVAVYEGMAEATDTRAQAVNATNLGFPVAYVSYDDSKSGTISYYVELNPGRTDTYEEAAYTNDLRTFFAYSTDNFATKTEWQWNNGLAAAVAPLDMRNFGQYKITFNGYEDATTTPIDVKISCFERDTNNKIGYTNIVGPTNGAKAASVYFNSGNSNNSCGDTN